MKTTRILILASVSSFAAALARSFATDPGLELLTSVFTLPDALSYASTHEIDTIVADTRLPAFDARSFSMQIQALRKPISLVLVSMPGDARIGLYSTVAADTVLLPQRESPLLFQTFAKELATRIKLSGLSRLRKNITLSYRWRPGMPFQTRFSGIIALGASAGGTEATQEVLKVLPPNMPGMIITQHMPPVFTKVYAERLNSQCSLTVREACDQDVVEPGVVLVAPGGMQMRLQRLPGRPHPIVRCGGQEKVSGHCPSVDVMFDSVARSMGRNAIGIILTGMGADGAEGLLSMRTKGCFTIGQDEQTSMVYGMPQVAYQKGAVASQLPLNEIPLALVSHLSRI